MALIRTYLMAIATVFVFITSSSASKATGNFYSGPGCQFPFTDRSIVGTCDNNCHAFAFDSMWAVGGTGKMRCVAYSDTNCQNQIADTGDDSGAGTCKDAPGAQSQKCFSGC